MGLRDIGAALPPGFRFYPSDEELVCHYLLNKITNQQLLKGTLVEVDLHTCEPWQLPEVAKLNSKEWYFFSFRDRKYATGYRTNRATRSGYWKATGKDRTVLDPRTRAVVGMRKTLVFYKNRAPNGTKTGWIMHEFRLENPNTPPKEDWVLCRVFHKGKGDNINILGPQNICDFKDGVSSPTLFAYPPVHQNSPRNLDQILSVPYPSNQIVQNSSNFLNLSTFDQNYFHPQHEFSEAPTNEMLSTKSEDEFGFLYDMKDMVPSSLEDIRFDEITSSSILM